MSDIMSTAAVDNEDTELNTAVHLIAATARTVDLLWPWHLRQVRESMCRKWSQSPTDYSRGDAIVNQLQGRLCNWLYRDNGGDETEDIPNENNFIRRHKPTVLRSHIDELSRGLASLERGDIDTCQSILKDIKWEPLNDWVFAHNRWQGSQFEIVPETIEGQATEENGSTAPTSDGGQVSGVNRLP